MAPYQHSSAHDATYDYIVVGAGSAGCALARRLAEAGSRVLLLEAGGKASNPLLHIPLGFAFLLKPHRNNWAYQTRPEPCLNNRRVDLPRGKVLGGCSAINGMVYVCGQVADYDGWGQQGWSYSDVRQYFQRRQDKDSGSLWVGNIDREQIKNEFPICERFIEAAGQAGHRFNTDINAGEQEGVGYFPHNIKNGKRWSSASAFLTHKPNNLTVITEAKVYKVLIENKKTSGVECDIKGEKKFFKVNREVVLCGGAINSPKLLELSGIGNAEILKKNNIPVVMDLPGVGENLHDHWNAYIKVGVRNAATYFSEAKPWPMLKNIFRYLFKKEGFLANPAALVAVFYKSGKAVDRADAQIHFAPAASNVDAKGNMVPIEGITVASCGLRPSSRGATHIASNNHADSPSIQVNYLQSEHDKTVAVNAFRKAREILGQSALKDSTSNEFEPGAQVESDADILDYIRHSGEPVHHLAGTCKMGNDAMAVVDEKLRVRGISGLRVADASIMPKIISGNTHAACVMIGEKAADLCLGEKSNG
jgi:choline dehydrogenase